MKDSKDASSTLAASTLVTGSTSSPPKVNDIAQSAIITTNSTIKEEETKSSINSGLQYTQQISIGKDNIIQENLREENKEETKPAEKKNKKEKKDPIEEMNNDMITPGMIEQVQIPNFKESVQLSNSSALSNPFKNKGNGGQVSGDTSNKDSSAQGNLRNNQKSVIKVDYQELDVPKYSDYLEQKEVSFLWNLICLTLNYRG